MRRFLAFVCLAPVCLSLLPAQYIPHRYIVELEGGSAVAALPAKIAAASRAAMLEAAAHSVRARQQQVAPALTARGARILRSLDTVMNGFTVEIPDDRAAALAQVPGVRKVYRVRQRKLFLDSAMPLMKFPEAWNLVGGASNAGAGVKIGIVDTGIDVRHPGFNDAGFPDAPEGYPKIGPEIDRRYTNKKVIVARSYDGFSPATDIEGHGTAVAMAAAGVTNTSPLGPITGAAPRAWLGNYKVFSDLEAGGSTSDDLIVPAIDDAVRDGMDVINASLGSVAIDAMSDDALVQAVNRAAEAGVIVVTAAGNDGPDPMLVSSPSTSPLALSVANTLNSRVFGTALTLSDGQSFGTLPSTNVPSTADPVSGVVADVAALDPTGLACTTLPANSLRSRVALIFRGTCNFSTKIKNAEAAGASGAIIYSQAGNPIGGWDPQDALLPAVLVDNAAGLKVKNAVAADSGLTATLEFRLRAIASDPNGMEEGSSRGPGPEGQIKPDLSATGTEILTAWISPATGNPSYTIVDGTSLSSPIVAGAAALLKQSKPGLTPAQYRSLLVNSASPLFWKGDPANPILLHEQGAGLLNAAAALATNLTAVPLSVPFGFGGADVDRTAKVTLTNTGAQPETYSLTVAPIGGGPAPRLTATSITLEPGAAQEVQVAIEASGLSAGAYQGYVLAQGSGSTAPVRIPYWYGVYGTTASFLPVVFARETGQVRSQQTILFRILGSAGVPAIPEKPPQFTVVSGGGSIVDWGSVDDYYPNTWGLLVRLGAARATDNVFDIQVGDVTSRVTIRTQ